MSYKKTKVAPASLVNSTIAMVPVLCGLLAYDQMVRGVLSIGTFVVAAFCAQNLILCFFWRRVDSEYVKSFLLYLSVSFQWGYVAAITAALWMGWKEGLWWANSIGLGVCAGGLALFSIKLGAERIGSSAIFSVLGVVATSVWGWMALNESNTELLAKAGVVEVSHLSSHSTSSDSDKKRGVLDHLPTLIAPSHVQWTYQGDEGPSHWAALKQEFATCSSGRQQSPVDLPRKAALSNTNVRIQYVPEDGTVSNSGHSIQVNLSGASKIVFKDSIYTLKQFHFHTPSEHTISGLMYPMEIHFVHANTAGQLAVIGVLVERGNEHAEFAKILSDIPTKIGEPTAFKGLQLSQLLPKDSGSWTYKGSLTTPPCTEGVEWAVFGAPVELSEKQIAAFRALYPVNARPTQPLFDRSFETKFPALAH